VILIVSVDNQDLIAPKNTRRLKSDGLSER